MTLSLNLILSLKQLKARKHVFIEPKLPKGKWRKIQQELRYIQLKSEFSMCGQVSGSNIGHSEGAGDIPIVNNKMGRPPISSNGPMDEESLKERKRLLSKIKRIEIREKKGKNIYPA